MWILKIFVFNFLVVLITEFGGSFFLGTKTVREAITIVLINVITNPALVLLSLFLSLAAYQWRSLGILVLEIAVVFIEGFMFKKFDVFNGKNTYLCSLLLNVVSFLTGEIFKFII